MQPTKKLKFSELLEEAVNKITSKTLKPLPVTTKVTKLSTVISNEMSSFEKNGQRGPNLTKVYEMLLTISIR